MSEAANQHVSGWLLCAASTLLAWRTRLNPLWLLGGGALLGLSGWL
jgi:chromate transporter